MVSWCGSGRGGRRPRLPACETQEEGGDFWCTTSGSGSCGERGHRSHGGYFKCQPQDGKPTIQLHSAMLQQGTDSIDPAEPDGTGAGPAQVGGHWGAFVLRGWGGNGLNVALFFFFPSPL